MRLRSCFLLPLCYVWLVLVFSTFALGQTESATLSGLITDPQGHVIPGVQVVVTNTDTDVSVRQETNGAGLYVFTALKPGRYRVSYSKDGFRRIDLTDLVLNVQDTLSRNLQLQVGSTETSITVTAEAATINTSDATVSTVVDRNFAENLPMNGRSFQTLIQLTPGIVLTPSSEGSEGQFSVNGQRSSANSWMVDGVSANIGIGANFNGGNGVAGGVGSFSALGGTNSLVSIDALQEFRVQTSTYAPEFGRSPGAQISIVTRSGSNQFHGTAFDYLRNYHLDANNWFANQAGLTKPSEHQNDFGGTFGGPIVKNRTFFFFSYEGLRLRLPSTKFTGVPDLSARQNATPDVLPFLNAYPLPNGTDNPATGVAEFNATFSNPATLNAYSLRLDHILNSKMNLFARYNYSPSSSSERGASTLYPLSDVSVSKILTQTATTGWTWNISPSLLNDFRFNYSRTVASSTAHLDTFGGAIPPASLPLPAPYSADNGTFIFIIFGLAHPDLADGVTASNSQRQFNIVDDVSIQRGSHSLKFGLDYRRLSPSFDPPLYTQEPIYLNVASATTNDLLGAAVYADRNSKLALHNLGIFAQDVWRISPRATLTYGVRMDTDFAPSSIDGPPLPAVTGYDLHDLSNLALAPVGTPPFATAYGLAPRVGLAFQGRRSPDWGLVVRGGFGVFYDLATSQVGDTLGLDYPFGAHKIIFGPIFGGTATFPLSNTDAAPPDITEAELSTPGATLSALDPHLKLPYTLEWNVAIQQQLGQQQTLTATYLGSAGRRLIQSANVSNPNPSFAIANLIGNSASSSYNALQIQFQRRLSRGFQALASYTWSHSIDDGSTGAYGIGSSSFVPQIGNKANRGPSDFDQRHVLSAALTYDIPVRTSNVFLDKAFRGWSIESVVQGWSAPPVNVFYSSFYTSLGSFAQVRPDVVPDEPLYLYGPQYPGGKAINAAAFTAPPLDTSGNPTRQGDLGRNALRGFGAIQWDFAIHREVQIHENIKLQFRAEMFNLINHPNFGPPIGDLQNPQSVNPQFGVSTETLNESYGGPAGQGGFNSLYQVGGPRSAQLSLKLVF